MPALGHHETTAVGIPDQGDPDDGEFSGGAIRGRIPEPGTASLLGGGLCLLARRRIGRDAAT